MPKFTVLPSQTDDDFNLTQRHVPTLCTNNDFSLNIITSCCLNVINSTQETWSAVHTFNYQRTWQRCLYKDSAISWSCRPPKKSIPGSGRSSALSGSDDRRVYSILFERDCLLSSALMSRSRSTALLSYRRTKLDSWLGSRSSDCCSS